MKNCTQLWYEAHFEVKMPKTPHVRRSFGSGNVGKKRTPLWREAHFEVKSVKTCGFGALLEVQTSKKCAGLWGEARFEAKIVQMHPNAQNTSAPEHFWMLRCGKSAAALWCEAHFQVKMGKAFQVRSTFGSSDVEKAHAVVAQRTFRSENAKTPHVSATFRCSSVVFAGRPKGFCTLQKVSKTWGFCGGGTFEEDLHRCISRRSEHQIVILASMILRDRCKFL